MFRNFKEIVIETIKVTRDVSDLPTLEESILMIRSEIVNNEQVYVAELDQSVTGVSKSITVKNSEILLFIAQSSFI